MEFDSSVKDEGRIEIIIAASTGEKITVKDINPAVVKVGRLKELVYRSFLLGNIPCANQELSFAGRALRDNEKLKSCSPSR